MRLQADKAGLDLALNLPQDPLFARADDTRLRQVLYNLLSNAIKFTDRGGRITVTGRISPPGKVEIWVVDTGIGMDAEEVAVALQPFMQVKQTGGRITAGTGLGLPFAKTIVELHGGRFDIVSIKGRGTTIKLTLPAG
jgi:two-component system cell cycle sensor histidine kinase PleC